VRVAIYYSLALESLVSTSVRRGKYLYPIDVEYIYWIASFRWYR